MESKKQKFISTLVAVCSGTSIFLNLSFGNLKKAIWHLFLISLICGFVMAAFNLPSLKHNILRVGEIVQSEFGSLTNTSTGIKTTVKPDDFKNVNFNYLQFTYAPTESDIQKIEINTEMNRSGIIITPKNIVSWFAFGVSSNEIYVFQGLTPEYTQGASALIYADQIDKFITETELSKMPQNPTLTLYMIGNFLYYNSLPINGALSFNSLFSGTMVYAAMIVEFLRDVIFAFAIALFFSLIFALIYRFAGRNFNRNFKYKNFLIMSLYASFPATIISTLFELAQPPWIQYQTIFIIVFVVYLVAVTSKIRLHFR